MTINIRDFAVRPDKFLHNYEDWLRAVLPEPFEVVAYEEVGFYQGQMFAVVRHPEVPVILWRGDFGSCSYCDTIEAACDFDGDGGNVDEVFDYMKATLAEGNTKQFDSTESAAAWLALDDLGYEWDEFPVSLLERAAEKGGAA